MRATVVGFGRSGQAMVRFLAGRGVQVAVSETRSRAAFTGAAGQLLADSVVAYEGDGHHASFFQSADCIVLSPGVDPAHPAITHAKQAGIPVFGELAVAASLVRSPIIAVTGTNGKTTVTELIGALLKAAGHRVFIGGNIGTPVGELLCAADPFAVVVLEVSSFQLEMSGGFVPQVGVLLNITPDHLDRHGTLERYAAMKMRLFQGGAEATEAIINGDDPLIERYLPPSFAGNALCFGVGAQRAARIEGSTIVVACGGRTMQVDLAGSSLDTVSGRMNGAAALLAVNRFALPQATVQETLSVFQVGAHRMQLVVEDNGVRFINDSKATNTGAVISALHQAGGRVVLIAGGRDKGDDYRLLREAVRQRVSHVVLIGEAAENLAMALGDLVPVHRAATMEDAVSRAAALAVAGDSVLLSPACASFDMFDNYQHRGDCFAAAVHRLRQQRPVAGVL